ncbi:hypothetical protein [Bacillus pinisoli]|uniref:hypothetical protein n=1 Tax=Bacillus pinisoli TaxID=2901866 RepID=UPI001FF1C81D|nr:hypothetical protein [Bacillus pinisoli]
MRGILLIVLSLIFMASCANSTSLEPSQEEIKMYDFILSIETDQGQYEKEDTIEISSYFEYVGEGIEFDVQPQITITIRNRKDGSIVKQVDFTDIKKTMSKGEKFSMNLTGLTFEKGKYDLFVSTSPFSIGPNNYLMNTVPLTFQVK